MSGRKTLYVFQIWRGEGRLLAAVIIFFLLAIVAPEIRAEPYSIQELSHENRYNGYLAIKLKAGPFSLLQPEDSLTFKEREVELAGTTLEFYLGVGGYPESNRQWLYVRTIRPNNQMKSIQRNKLLDRGIFVPEYAPYQSIREKEFQDYHSKSQASATPSLLRNWHDPGLTIPFLRQSFNMSSFELAKIISQGTSRSDSSIELGSERLLSLKANRQPSWVRVTVEKAAKGIPLTIRSCYSGDDHPVIRSYTIIMED